MKRKLISNTRKWNPIEHLKAFELGLEIREHYYKAEACATISHYTIVLMKNGKEVFKTIEGGTPCNWTVVEAFLRGWELGVGIRYDWKNNILTNGVIK